ncbi:hypothetical protein [Glycomyces harbinensis]|uniref:Uncharacterized protein n=1 Tax=Glycomyces harbinensis TaxID=58114 RepID=A0A1G7DH96_9ACTN|nr:hypothetical protein [Glycomyces harbinensis]SDE50921.1 hypothetical protein SAMN05216270_12530 [Glycomyces harbinensis]
MTDRPNPDAAPPEQPRPEPPAAPVNPAEPLNPTAPPNSAASPHDAPPSPEPRVDPQVDQHPDSQAFASVEAEPPSHSYAEPIPEPGRGEAAPEQVPSDPRAHVEAVAEPAAPAQVAPDPGAAPIPLEPEPSVPEPADAASVPSAALESPTDQTLALPPTTKEVEPPPVPSAPPPPPSGVPVPFAAPPTDVNGGRLAMKLAFGIGGGVALVATVVIAVVVAFTTFTNSVLDKMESTAEDFIAEVADEDWDSAYAMLCDDLRERPVEDYTGEWESWDADTAEVQPMSVEATEVEVELADGSSIALTVEVDQSAEALDTNICGWRSVSG